MSVILLKFLTTSTHTLQQLEEILWDFLADIILKFNEREDTLCRYLSHKISGITRVFLDECDVLFDAFFSRFC